MNDLDLNSIELKPATADDEKFLVTVYKSSRGDDLRELGWDEDRVNEFLEMQYQAQRTFDQTDHAQASDQIILLAGKPVGRLFVESTADEVRCVDLSLLPEFRTCGIGTFLVRKLQRQAAAANKPLRSQVIRFSRAINLFERLGFIRTSETGTHFQMEWTPGNVRSPTVGKG